ncbi:MULTISPECIES: SDR family oxidoreductase [Thermomonospora]|uniref:3-oxoacyl-[acyl-carrier protein] reductase n=1 Tax=Thermomonospora cellulosilytica TaxID=1411118 RepID=A0A7W3N415_9ACTN|nr:MULTISPECIES: SDR family oxidoreductase [Thermomonospora]MBA9007068.1 3-oxoacyl-[acyl-carrier protein] reductase [Thermomonospora cellulosilytica]
MDLGLTGRRAAVAAASSGLGLATARALAAEGVQVAICGRDRERLEKAAAAIGENAHPIVADVGTPEGATAFVHEAQRLLGGVDILVTNAGGPPPGGFDDIDLDAYRAALDLNLMSVVAMCKAAVPPMRERRWGRVLAITSISVRQPISGLILSNTARAGATGFLKTLALEVARDGVTVNSLLPGSHATDRLRRLHGGDLSKAAEAVPMGRVGDPDDFGAYAAFLCSEQARFITGTAVPVDGGAYLALL